MRRKHLFRTPLVVLFVLLWSNGNALITQILCDHPADSLPSSSEVRRLHASFDAPGANRVFSETHYHPGDPHLTVGMGHWTYENLFELFRRLRAETKLWREMLQQWHAALAPTMWVDFAADTGIKGRTIEGLEQGLIRLLCVTGDLSCKKQVFQPWTQTRAGQFNQATNWFRAGWGAVSRLEGVAAIQVQWWLDSVVLPAEAKAIEMGVTSLGAVASLASARSTSTGYVKLLTDKMKAVKGVPPSARPRNASIDEERLLRDWKAAVAWNEYNRIRKDIRSRMRVIWRVYFESTWGPMPKSAGDLSSIRHSGCYMETRPFERSVELVVSSTCSAPSPMVTPTKCSK